MQDGSSSIARGRKGLNNAKGRDKSTVPIVADPPSGLYQQIGESITRKGGLCQDGMKKAFNRPTSRAFPYTPAESARNE